MQLLLKFRRVAGGCITALAAQWAYRLWELDGIKAVHLQHHAADGKKPMF
jgi:hypothetical protein